LNTCGTIIDCKKEKILTKFDGESYEFNFSKFTRAPYETELPNEDFRVEQLASITLALKFSPCWIKLQRQLRCGLLFLSRFVLLDDLSIEDSTMQPSVDSSSWGKLGSTRQDAHAEGAMWCQKLLIIFFVLLHIMYICTIILIHYGRNWQPASS
jgi:hypothetical protein